MGSGGSIVQQVDTNEIYDAFIEERDKPADASDVEGDEAAKAEVVRLRDVVLSYPCSTELATSLRCPLPAAGGGAPRSSKRRACGIYASTSTTGQQPAAS